ncbi:MAG TPA: methionine ABC transporter permease [Anaerovoracaceae bacterium]|nr:methionine ABC transporter permease [Anaerovoracaceae bacterium]
MMTELFLQGLWDTIYMTIVATLIAYIIGLPLGVSLVVTDSDGIYPMPILHNIIGLLVNVVRSVPFLILLIAMIPLTRIVVGTSIGTNATIFVLIVAAAPFIARMVESSIKEVDAGVIEAAQSMGASNMTIILKVMLSEAKPALIVGTALSTITILGYSAMAGVIGGGGLGDIAIKYGLYHYEAEIMWMAVAILVIVVQVLQEIGMRYARKIDNRL